MSVQTEIDRIITAVGAAYDAVEAKGGTLPASETVANLAEAINSIPKETHQAVEQATPSLTLNAATGVVTAEATQAAGLVAAGTKKATMQLATQAAKTVTPSAAQQTAVASGKYTTGDVVVAAVPTEAKTVELSMPSGNQTVSPDAGKFLSAVTVKKPATMLPENIKKGVSIGGVVGTLESGGGGSTSETWVLNNIISTLSAFSFSVSFTSNGASYTGLKTSSRPSLSGYDLWYTNSSGSYDSIYNAEIHYWADAAYRKLVFDEAPTGDLLTWLTANGVKQPANLAVQPSKDVTVTSNGTTEITPDAPYDVMEKANVTVAVEQTAGFKVTFPATADANWAARVAAARLLKSDGTFVNFTDYSVVAGKSVSNVIAITIPPTNSNYVARYTFSGGMLGIDGGLLNMTNTPVVRVENSPSYTPYYGGDRYWHVFTADTVITKLEIYNTD